jgi:tetratricopeptide (TPR) repeat protein
MPEGSEHEGRFRRTQGMRRTPIVLLCGLLALAPLTGCNRIRGRVELKKGNKLYKAESYKEALEQFQLGLRLDPSAKRAWRSVALTGMALYKPGVDTPDNNKYVDLTIDALQKYLTAYPDDTNAEDYMVAMWVNANRYDKAIEYLKKQRLEHPGEAKIEQGLINVMVKANRYDDALQWINNNARKNAKLYYLIETNAWGRSYNDPTVSYEDRTKIVDLGLDAGKRAVEAKPDYMEAMVYINLLYREKVKLSLDPKEKEQFTKMADEWRQKALDLREKQKKAPKPAGA